MATLGELTELCVAFNGNRGSITLIYGDRRKKRTRRMKPCAPGAVKSGILPAAVPSFLPPSAQPEASGAVQGGGGGEEQNRRLNSWRLSPVCEADPDSPSRRCGKGVVSKKWAPRPSSSGPSSLHLSAPVELPPMVVAPVEQVAQKRKATTDDPSHQLTIANTLGLARSRIKGRLNNYITPPLKLPHLPEERDVAPW